MAQPEQLLGEAVGVCRVGQRPDQRVVLQQPVQHVAGLPWSAGDRLRCEHAEPVGDVGVKRDRPVVVAEVAGVDRAQQAVALHGEALAVGGGQGAIAQVRLNGNAWWWSTTALFAAFSVTSRRNHREAWWRRSGVMPSILPAIAATPRLVPCAMSAASSVR